MSVKTTTLKVLIDGEIVELMVKTTGEQVYLDDTTTLSAKLEEFIAALNLKAVDTDVTKALNDLRIELQGYTDGKITALVNGAPATLDTLKELADAMANNDSVVESINSAITNKADASVLSSHTSDTNNPHNVTKSQVGLGNVDNTADADKSVKHAGIADADGNGKNIADTYATKDEMKTATSGSTIYAQSEQPGTLKTGDVWFQITS